MQTIVMLATVHEYQREVSIASSELQECLEVLSRKFGVEIVMEKWSEDVGRSVPQQMKKFRLRWANVGTPNEERFQTYTGPTDPLHPEFPPMDKYGPFEKQEAREIQMAKNVQSEMEGHKTGLFVLGLAHLHSMFGRLRSLGFEVEAFSWIHMSALERS